MVTGVTSSALWKKASWGWRCGICAVHLELSTAAALMPPMNFSTGISSTAKCLSSCWQTEIAGRSAQKVSWNEYPYGVVWRELDSGKREGTMAAACSLK